jgi:hypothetical protein
VINSDDPDTPSYTVNLTGSGYQVPTINVVPLTLNFGSISVGTTATLNVAVSNTGAADLTILTVTSPGSVFTIVGNTCLSGPIIPGGSCSISVKFAPASNIIYNSNFTITSNAFNAPSVTVNLTGTGAPAPNITASPNPLTFPNVPVNTTQSQNITVTNNGSAPLTITSVTNPGGDFSMPANSCMGIIAAAGSCTISIDFKPTSIGSKTSSVTINSDDPDTPALTVNISGSGFVGPNNAKISVSPSYITFPNTTVGTTSTPRSFTVTNIGTTPLVISSVTYPKTPYRVVGDTCTGQTLAASGTCSVNVVFNPASAGYFYAYFLYFISNEPDTPKMGVYVNGAGVR